MGLGLALVRRSALAETCLLADGLALEIGTRLASRRRRWGRARGPESPAHAPGRLKGQASPARWRQT
jgi:hypothetical protein